MTYEPTLPLQTVRAERVLNYYGGITAKDKSTVLADVLADLMHYAGDDFDIFLKAARVKYRVDLVLQP